MDHIYYIWNTSFVKQIGFPFSPAIPSGTSSKTQNVTHRFIIFFLFEDCSHAGLPVPTVFNRVISIGYLFQWSYILLSNYITILK